MGGRRARSVWLAMQVRRGCAGWGGRHGGNHGTRGVGEEGGGVWCEREIGHIRRCLCTSMSLLLLQNTKL